MHNVPLYSQHLDVRDEKWREHACGIAALKIVLDYYGAETPPLDTLIARAAERGAYLEGVGWKHRELAELAGTFGLRGEAFDWAALEPEAAYQELLCFFPASPVLASIYNDFDAARGGHIVVLTGLDGDTISYADPDATERGSILRTVSKDVFLRGWKRRIVLITPTTVL